MNRFKYWNFLALEKECNADINETIPCVKNIDSNVKRRFKVKEIHRKLVVRKEHLKKEV